MSTYYESLEGMLYRFDRIAAADRFKGNTRDELLKWQEKERAVLSDLIGLEKLIGHGENIELNDLTAGDMPDKAADSDCAQRKTRPNNINGPGKKPAYECIETGREVLKDGIIRCHQVFRVDEFTQMPMYVLLPACESQGTVIALAGHQGAGKESVAGVTAQRIVREKIRFFNYDYGLKLAQMGYTVICPDPRGFGERRDVAAQGDSKDKILGSSCRNLSNMAIPLGLSVIGLCVYDLVRLIDYLSSGINFNIENLTVAGFSGGGMQALYLSALDKRVKKTLISGYMYGFKDSHLILNNNCSCNYVPHLWEHLDMGDIGSLIAPRPLIIQSCREDHLNGPRGLDNVYEQVEIIRRAYELYGADDALIHDIRPGEHHFHDECLEYLKSLRSLRSFRSE